MYETWKPTEIDSRYEVSNLGRFRKKIKKGYRYLKPFKKYNRNMYVIKINGKEYICSRLVANAFIQPLKPNDRVFHKNRLEFDNFYRNLEVLNKVECGEKTGFIARSRSVVLIKDGEIKKTWRSARKAAKDLFISKQTVCEYCHNRTKKKMFNLMWEDDYFEKLEKKEGNYGSRKRNN